MESKTRYFIVVYVATVIGANVTCTGQCSMTVKNGGFLNKASSVKLIQGLGGAPIKDIVITNIIELSESDYKDWHGDN